MSTEYGVGRLKLVVIIMRLLVRSLGRSGKYSLDSKLSPFRIKGVGDKRVYLSIAVPLGLLNSPAPRFSHSARPSQIGVHLRAHQQPSHEGHPGT